jgi:hypothetical protein
MMTAKDYSSGSDYPEWSSWLQPLLGRRLDIIFSLNLGKRNLLRSAKKCSD